MAKASMAARAWLTAAGLWAVLAGCASEAGTPATEAADGGLDHDAGRVPDASREDAPRWLVFKTDGEREQVGLFAYDLVNGGEPISIGVPLASGEWRSSYEPPGKSFGWSDDGRAFGYLVEARDPDDDTLFMDDLVVMTVDEQPGPAQRMDLPAITGFEHPNVLHVEWAPRGSRLAILVEEYVPFSTSVGLVWVVDQGDDTWRARPVGLDASLVVHQTHWISGDKLLVIASVLDKEGLLGTQRYFVVDVADERFWPRELLVHPGDYSEPRPSSTGRYVSFTAWDESIVEVFDTDGTASPIAPIWTGSTIDDAAWTEHGDRLLYWHAGDLEQEVAGAADVALLYELDLQASPPAPREIEGMRVALDDRGQLVEEITFAAWSPSAERVVVRTLRRDDTARLRVLDLASGELTLASTVDDAYFDDPHFIGWTQGERVLYVETEDVRVFDASSDRSYRLFEVANASAVYEDVVLARDGSTLAVRAGPANPRVLACTDLDADPPTVTTVLAYDAGYNFHLAGSAQLATDGSALATTAVVGDPGQQVLDIVSFGEGGSIELTRLARPSPTIGQRPLFQP